ncbi:DNA-directed RNA polymerase I subunit RPA12 [Eufriesea mexicana]|uniref:DNA-directed RNA polymerase I subunit RPA12 n=1 Tax=Eufriesea mexicana TaxID=516756 RepID=UPI00083BC356|nr:PREDICTED: DNA-directed RNA polymerase I subunit RPA12 [Eufriesea mexicana]OAD59165.1 DNA-directed RNA polymerase I subunit RPA12 [Eufriesea mexicana]
MEQNNSTTFFISTPGFCSDCGSILPLLSDRGNVNCYTCKRSWGPEAFGDMKMSYTVHFNSKNTYASSKQKDKEENADGPIVERKCPQCQNDKMSYATLQLRSADEGQTVFYTCTKCKFKETENS